MARKSKQPKRDSAFMEAEQREQARKQRVLLAKRSGVHIDNLLDELHLLAKAEIPAAHVAHSRNMGLSVQVDKCWSVSATLYLYLNPRPKDTVIDDLEKKAYTPCDFRVELSWSSTARNVAQALAAIELYRQLTVLGANMEAIIMSRTPYLVETVENDDADPINPVQVQNHDPASNQSAR